MSVTLLLMASTLGLAWIIEMRRADRLEAVLRRIETELARHDANLRDRPFAREKQR